MATALNSPVETSILDLINERLDSWRTILQAHQSSFNDLAEIERQAHLGFTKIATTLGGAASVESSATTPISSSSPSWLGPLQAYALRCSLDGESFGRFVKESSLPQLEGLWNDLRGRGKEIKARLADTQMRLSKQHEAMTLAMATHEKGWKVRTLMSLASAEDESLAEAISMTDVFISEQQLRHRISIFLEEKKTYCATLIEMYNRTRLLEQDLAAGLKGTVGEILRVKEKQLTAATEQISDCLSITRSAEVLIEWQNAVRRFRLDWDWNVEAPPADGFLASALTQIGCSLSTDEMEPQVKPVRIIKSGFLMRPSTFGRSWNVVFCLLVDSGFLHCYSPDAIKTDSIKKSTSSDNPPGEYTKNYRVPSPTMRLHAKALNELNQAATKVWLGGITRSGAMTLSESSSESISPSSFDSTSQLLQSPTLSIPLLHPDTSIVPDPKAGPHAFAITVPGGSSFFGRSERRHVLGSFVEENMVDWCIALKEQLGGAPIEVSRPSSPHRDAFAFGESITTQVEPIEEASFDPASFRKRSSIIEGDDEIVRSSTPTTPIENMENPWD